MRDVNKFQWLGFHLRLTGTSKRFIIYSTQMVSSHAGQEKDVSVQIKPEYSSMIDLAL